MAPSGERERRQKEGMALFAGKTVRSILERLEALENELLVTRHWSLKHDFTFTFLPLMIHLSVDDNAIIASTL